jgi:cell wall assembly regulator SMI1
MWPVGSDIGNATMHTLIQRADAWLKANRPDYYAILRPGADDAALDAYQARFGLVLPMEFRQLYRWRDGQDTNVLGEALVYNHTFIPLCDSASSKELLDDMIGADFDDPAWWRRGWVPFTTSFGGDHYCLDLQAEGGGKPGRIIDFWHDEPTRNVLAPSLTEWFRELVVAMEGGRLELA